MPEKEWDYDDNEELDDDVCDGCGQSDGQCPLCCGHMYAPGSEECDFCNYNDECLEYANRIDR